MESLVTHILPLQDQKRASVQYANDFKNGEIEALDIEFRVGDRGTVGLSHVVLGA